MDAGNYTQWAAVVMSGIIATLAIWGEKFRNFLAGPKIEVSLRPGREICIILKRARQCSIATSSLKTSGDGVLSSNFVFWLKRLKGAGRTPTLPNRYKAFGFEIPVQLAGEGDC
jgi:hypothetical protein